MRLLLLSSSRVANGPWLTWAQDELEDTLGGAREIDAGQFFQMPNQNLYGESVLQPDEIVTHVVLPAPGQRSATYEVRFKPTHDSPRAGADFATKA